MATHPMRPDSRHELVAALDFDCLFTMLCNVSGSPSKQAVTLAQAALTCSMLRLAAGTLRSLKFSFCML